MELPHTIGALSLFVVLATEINAQSDDSVPTPQTVLEGFQKAWQPSKGSLRPLKDEAWKVRFQSFQQLVRLGEKATPALTVALIEGDTDTRVFAAQALTFRADRASQPALTKALQDKHPAVRLYAIDALSMFGRLKITDAYQQLRDKDGNRDVRSHMSFALERDDEPQPEAIRKLLLDYDVADLDSAKIGKSAPDFTLSDPKGQKHQLSDWRGKKTVVLIFIYGDT